MKKAIKIAGHLLMLAAAVFLIRRILRMQIDPAEMLQPRVIAALCLSTAVQTAVIVCGTYPWLVFTRALSGRSIPFRQAMPVFTRSNLYKYVPGNVFQYVGRNKLAEDAQVSHVDVACATVLDVLGCVISTGIISVILLGSAAFGLLRQRHSASGSGRAGDPAEIPGTGAGLPRTLPEGIRPGKPRESSARRGVLPGTECGFGGGVFLLAAADLPGRNGLGDAGDHDGGIPVCMAHQ